jgi:hypothetical protein
MSNRVFTALSALIRFPRFILFIVYFIATEITGMASGPLTEREKDHYVFSAIRGNVSRADTLNLNRDIQSITWLSGDSTLFKAKVDDPKKLILSYAPSKEFIGTSKAKLKIQFRKNDSRTIEVTGLSTRALEGENEAPLATIFDVLKYPVNIGWKTLAHHCRPEQQGEEVRGQLFQKAGRGKISIIPLARYSPDFKLGFGYYTANGDSVTKQEAGVLSVAGKYPEHQTLYPAYSVNSSLPDPGNKTFGFYAESPTHTAFTEDVLNARLFPKYVTHAARVFPLKRTNGQIEPNTFLLCFEEAKNGDYNDYVFIITNVKMVTP